MSIHTINKKLIVPACGDSTRFNGDKPKWLRTHPSGNAMIVESLRGVIHNFDTVYIAVRYDHVDKWKFVGSLTKQIKKLSLGTKVEFVQMGPTSHQPQTIYHVLTAKDITGHFVCKDTDNFFNLTIPYSTVNNFVAYVDLEDIECDARGKSYIRDNSHNELISIVEKKIVSNKFCCGLYGFNVVDFKRYYREATTVARNHPIYLSHIYHQMLLDDVCVRTISATEYVDWGTQELWNKYREQFEVYFLDIDGILLSNTCPFTEPFTGTGRPLQKNIDRINELYRSGKAQIILTTARPNSLGDKTKNELANHGINYHYLLTGLWHASRTLVNDYADSNPFPSAKAINVKRNDSLEGLV